MKEYYVVVRQTKDADYPVVSGYSVEAENADVAQRLARNIFSADTGYDFQHTTVQYIKPARRSVAL